MQSRNNLRVALSPFLFTDLKRAIMVFLSLFLLASLSSFIPSALASKEYEAAHPGKKVYYFLNDHLGSVDKVLDSDGNIVEERDFLPYGEERVSESYSGNKAKTITDHKFTGKELDDETGLYYYGARYYDPLIGRFISQDPWEGSLMSPQTLNKYSYVVNNPVRYVDPSGAKLSDFQPYGNTNKKFYEEGELFGTYKGVDVISGGLKTTYDSNPYQCVELAKNFAAARYGVSLKNTGNGVDYSNQRKIDTAFRKNKNSNTGSYVVYKNSGKIMPREDDLISWSGGEVGYGHVGVIVEVVFDEETGKGTVHTIEQNWSKYKGLFSQELIRDENMNYTIKSRSSDYKVRGWARYEEGRQSTMKNLILDVLRPTYTSVATSVKSILEQPKK